MRGTWAGAVAAVLITTCVAACADSTSSGATDQPSDRPTGSATTSADPSPTSDAPPTEEEGCPYLSAEQVTAALGTPTHETAGTLNACFFDPDGGEGGASVLLSRVDVQIDPADYAHQSRQLCEGEVTDVDAGDVAFACVMGLGPQGQVYAGRVLVTVSVNDAVDDATGIADAAALLPEVTIPPSAG
jgi:hypothetical protein